MIAAYVALQEGWAKRRFSDNFATLQLTRNRTEWKRASNGTDILSDVYNANPTAIRLILETFSTIPANPNGRKLAVLADMKELGGAICRSAQSNDPQPLTGCLGYRYFLWARHCGLGSISGVRCSSLDMSIISKNSWGRPVWGTWSNKSRKA